MVEEWQDKAENPVECGRSSMAPIIGGVMPTPVPRVRQPHKAKEPLCGNQPANVSLVNRRVTFSVLFRYFAALVIG